MFSFESAKENTTFLYLKYTFKIDCKNNNDMSRYLFDSKLYRLLAGIPYGHVRIQRGGDRGSEPPPPHEKSQNLGFLSNTGLDRLKTHKATKPEFNVTPAKFPWRADGGPLLVVFGSSLPQST